MAKLKLQIDKLQGTNGRGRWKYILNNMIWHRLLTGRVFFGCQRWRLKRKKESVQFFNLKHCSCGIDNFLVHLGHKGFIRSVTRYEYYFTEWFFYVCEAYAMKVISRFQIDYANPQYHKVINIMFLIMKEVIWLVKKL